MASFFDFRLFIVCENCVFFGFSGTIASGFDTFGISLIGSMKNTFQMA